MKKKKSPSLSKKIVPAKQKVIATASRKKTAIKKEKKALSKQHEAEAIKVYHAYWVSYLKGDMKAVASFLDDDYKVIGSSEGEVFFNKIKAMKYYKATAAQIAGKAKLRNRIIKVEAIDGLILITEQADFYVLIETEWTFYSKGRISSLLHKKAKDWKFIQQHGSLPDHKAEEGETIGLEKISKENLELRDAVKRRTIELEEKNHELVIEAALERVRARAMAMQNSDELAELVSTVFQELTRLDFSLTSCIIWIHNSEPSTNELWIASAEANKPAQPFRINPFHEAFFKSVIHAWKARDKKWVFNLKGKEKKEFEAAFFKAIPNLPAPLRKALANPKEVSFSASFNNFGALEIVETAALTDVKFDILHRFGKVFNSSYTRFNDLKKAEAQTREAQIEVAVERVRAKALAMHRSEEIIHVVNTLRDELDKLKIPGIVAATIILQQENGSIRLWDITSVVELEDGFHFSMDILFTLDGTKPDDWIRRIWDGTEKYFVIKQDGKSIKRTVTWTRKYNPEFAENAQRFLETNNIKNGWHPVVPLSHGKLSLDLLQEPVVEVESILTKIGAAFDLAYKRFLDLQKAEAQAREAKIEAALERVRSRSMGMQKSEELREVIQVIYEQFVQLNIQINTVGFILDYKEREDLNFWVANKMGVPTKQQFPYFDSPHWSLFIEAKQKGLDFFADTLTFEEKNKFFQQVFGYTPGFPEETKDFFYSTPGWAASTVLLKSVCLFIDNLEGIPFADAENAILIRFAKVFEQTYTRFLDLQKVEAQAREAQIKLSLERVRSKTMAMHSSQDVGKTVATMFDEMAKLEFHAFRFGIAIFHETMDLDAWTIKVNPDGEATLIIGKLDTNIHPMLQGVYKAWKTKEPFFTYELANQDLKTYYSAINNSPDYPVRFDLNTLPERQIHTDFFFADGALFAFTTDPIPSEKATILKRFSGVFGQTYRRYIDLQKAEAQTREAKIEAALEKVRSRSLAMYKSEELKEVVSIVFEKLRELNVSMDSACILTFWENSKGHTAWAANPDLIDVNTTPIPYFDHPIEKAIYDARDSGKEFIAESWSKEVKNSHWQHLFEHSDYKYLPDDLKQAIFDFEGWGFTGPVSKSTATLLVSYSGKLFSENETEIIKRFGKVFEQAYTRFLDLQKAEAQAREAKIEAALERVRSRAMAMHKSAELSEVIERVYTEFQNLGFDALAADLMIFTPDGLSYDLWVSYTGKTEGPYRTSGVMLNHPHHLGTLEAWKRGDSIRITELAGDFLTSYFDAALNETSGWNFFSDELKKGILRLKSEFHTEVFTQHGCIRVASLTRRTEEQLDIQQRFVNVFDQTYTRFLDLQKAEAQAREAQIQLALERVRARTMAMQRSNELQDVANTIYERLNELKVEMDFANLASFLEGSKDYYVWVGGLSEPIRIPFNDFTQVQREYNAALERRDELFTHTFSGEIKDEYHRFLLEQTELGRSLPDEQKKKLLDAEFNTASLALTKNTCIQWVRLNDKAFSNEENELLKRFVNVFEQAYTRFLDLQKAEAQTREAQIEIAVERVRAKALAMHKSDEIMGVAVAMRMELES